MDLIGDRVRRSARIWCHRLAEDEPETYISLPGKKRFKKDSRTWLHKSSKRYEARKAKEAKKLACSPVKGVQLISPLKDALITLDFTENDDSYSKSLEILPEPKKAVHFNTTGKNFQVIQDRDRPMCKKGKSAKVHLGNEDSNTFGDINGKNPSAGTDVNTFGIKNEERDIVLEAERHGIQRNPTAIDVIRKKGVFRNTLGIVLSDSELCLRANRLALECNQDLSQKKSNTTVSGKIDHQCNSTRGEDNDQGQRPLKTVHGKRKFKRVVVSKVGRKIVVSGSRKMNKTQIDLLKSQAKPIKNKNCSKHLKKKAFKHLAKKSQKEKLLRHLKQKTPGKSLDKDQKTSNTSVSSQKGKPLKRRSSCKKLDKKNSKESVRKTPIGDTNCRLKDSRCAKLTLKRYHSFTTSLSECTIPTTQLLGGLSEITLGRSISEAGMSALENRDEFLQRRSSSGNCLLFGKSSRSADRLVRVSQSRKSLDNETFLRKRKGKLDDRSSSTSMAGLPFQQKRSRDSLVGAKKGSGQNKAKQLLSAQSSYHTAKSGETYSSSESSLQVQCSITTGILDDTDSCASSTVVEQGSFCSLGGCASTGYQSTSRLDVQDSLFDKEDSAHLRPLKDQHHFNLTASPGNHCLTTVNLQSLDLPLENNFLSAHKLHRTKALATTSNLNEEWELVSKSDSSILESETLIWK